MHECRLLRDSGQTNRALMLLEPLEMDIAALTDRLKNAKAAAKQHKTGVTFLDFAPFEAMKKREQLAERILLATQCMVDSKQKHGKALIDRFSLIVDLHKSCKNDDDASNLIALQRAQQRGATSHFEFARYAESLYHEARAKEEQEEQSNFSSNAVGGKGSSTSAASGKRGSGGSNKRGRSRDDNDGTGGGDAANAETVTTFFTESLTAISSIPFSLYHHLRPISNLYHHLRPISTLSSLQTESFHYIELAVTQYTYSIGRYALNNSGKEDCYLLQALPRLLTLWLTFTAIRDPSLPEHQEQRQPIRRTNSTVSGVPAHSSSSPAHHRATARANALKHSQRKLNALFIKIREKYFPPVTWYSCISQLVSRAGHSNEDTLNTVVKILGTLLEQFPHQALWHIAGLVNSQKPERRKIGQNLVRDAQKSLRKTGEARKLEDAQMLADSEKLFPELIALAQCQPNKAEMKNVGGKSMLMWRLQNRVDLKRFLVLRLSNPTLILTLTLIRP